MLVGERETNWRVVHEKVKRRACASAPGFAVCSPGEVHRPPSLRQGQRKCSRASLGRAPFLFRRVPLAPAPVFVFVPLFSRLRSPSCSLSLSHSLFLSFSRRRSFLPPLFFSLSDTPLTAESRATLSAPRPAPRHGGSPSSSGGSRALAARETVRRERRQAAGIFAAYGLGRATFKDSGDDRARILCLVNSATRCRVHWLAISLLSQLAARRSLRSISFGNLHFQVLPVGLTRINGTLLPLRCH